MNKKTKKALEGSIKKWEKIVSGKGGDDGTDNCPLCLLFYYDSCVGCPVSKSTGIRGCIDSPYNKFTAHHQRMHNVFYPYEIECKICERHAKAEVEFLKSLRE